MTEFKPQPFIADPHKVMADLNHQAQHLAHLADALADVERQLEKAEAEYQKHVDDFEIGLWQRSQDEDGFKLPSESLRLKLAHKEMDPALLGRYIGLKASRDRLEKRIRNLRTEVDAQRSILSALKTEAEAGGGNLRRAA